MPKAPEFQRVKYVSDRIPELQNQWVDVPGDLPLERAAKWIEESHAARAEQERIDAESQQLADEALSAGPEAGELDLLREELAGIHSRLDSGDAAQYSQAISNNAAAMRDTFDLSRQLEGLRNQAREAVEADQHTLDSSETFLREVHAERDRTMALIKSNQKIANASISSTTKAVAELRQQLADASREIGELKAAATAHRQLINKAARIIKSQQSSAPTELPPANSTEGRVSK